MKRENRKKTSCKYIVINHVYIYVERIYGYAEISREYIIQRKEERKKTK
jgi:hypothetical protein